MRMGAHSNATRYNRPRLAKHVIARPAVISKLQETVNYALTIVRAGAGYGKSTLINQSFPDAFARTVWLHLSEQDQTVFHFLTHLVQAIQTVLPCAQMKTLSLLRWDERQGTPNPVGCIETLAQDLALVRERTIIILDDFQYTGNTLEIGKITEQLVDLLPEAIHVVIASREKVNLPGLAFRRARGEVLDIDEADLAFHAGDIARLFQEVYGITLEEKVARQLAARTEGWIMAIHMLGQNMKKGGSWDTALTALPQSLSELFEFLAQDYLTKQPAFIRKFLFTTAHLEVLRPEICNYLLETEDSAGVLKELEQKGLFTFRIGDRLYRYHHLFQEFLRKNGDMNAGELRQLHYHAGSWYAANNDPAAIGHYLAGGYFAEAAVRLKQHLADKSAVGFQARMAQWLDALPTEVLSEVPELLLGRGDIYRLEGDFPNALRLYTLAQKAFAAEENRRGQYLTAIAFALVYLDTVQPVTAEGYLTMACSLADSADIPEKARLYQLMAENKINLGRAEEAAALFVQANELFLEDSRGDVEARMHLRTGRLLAAKQILSRRERLQGAQLPKSHRETSLLLSLINTFMGDIDEAWQNAQEGLNVGRQSRAVFVEAVGYMRLGHAKQLKSWLSMEEAVDCYQQALHIVSSLQVERGKAEPLCGLCLLYGHQGNLDSAVRYGLEGIRVGRQSQDDWMTAMIEQAMAIAYYKVAQLEQAAEWAERAYTSFAQCGDSYLSTVALFWQARIALDQGNANQFRSLADSLLFAAQAHDYDFIFHKPTLLGLRDLQGAMPLLLAAHKENIRSEYVSSVLTELGLQNDLAGHPGYTLRVQALGPFMVWRGMQEVKPREWQREKAKRLFQYFITNRKKLVHKEQVLEMLWGEDGTDSDFKVAMNAMVNVLEPNRHARKTPFYVAKNDSAYGLNLAAGIAIDVDEFESYIGRARRIEAKDPEQAVRLYRMALNLYKGDFLQECCYEDWCVEERERLLILYLTTAERMAHMLYERGETEECISLCNRILGKDRCWEGAYMLLMRCYFRQNNRAMVAKTFRQCQENLKTELGVAPAEGTTQLYKKLMQ